MRLCVEVSQQRAGLIGNYRMLESYITKVSIFETRLIVSDNFLEEPLKIFFYTFGLGFSAEVRR